MQNSQRISKKKIFFILGTFLLLLTALRVGWMFYYQPIEQPAAENGVIDLRDWDFNNNDVVTLDGEWKFIPNEFISASTFEKQQKNDVNSITQINVPSDWRDTVDANESELPYGHGTYYLNVLLPENDDELLDIRFQEIKTAANIYVDDQLIIERGTVAANADDAKGTYGPFSNSLNNQQDQISIVVHVSNFDSPVNGGITESITIGNESAIANERRQPIILQLVISIVYLIHALYAFAVYFIERSKAGKEILFFGILLLFHGMLILLDDDVVVPLPVDFLVYQRILFILFLTTLLLLVLFIKYLFNIQTQFYKWLIGLFIINMFLVVFGSVHYFHAIGALITLLYMASIIFLLYYGVKVTNAGFPDAILVLLFVASYSSNFIWGLAINFNIVTIPFYPIDFLVSTIVMALLFIRKHIHVAKVNEIQTIELQKMDKARDEFLANTSHELRNPLHGIVNIAESLLQRENPPLSMDSKADLQLLTNIGKRMAHTLNDLTTITQLREDKIQLAPSVVHLHTITKTVIDMLEFMKEGKDIELISHIPTDFPTLWADENRLIQILFNLVHNAIKYTEYGSIQVTAEVNEAQEAVIYVADTGIGIDSDQINNIFNPYEQVEDHHLAKAGIGIGLAISKELVELHNGTITFESNDSGTTFIFTVPLSTEAQFDEEDGHNNRMTRMEIAAIEEPVVDYSTPHITNDSTTILIIDDDPVNLRVLEKLLKNEYEVITCINPQEALDTIALQQIDIIISDVMMPHMSGYELTQRVREKYTITELPILLITARNTPEDIRIAFKSGANDYLVKPVDALELRTRIRSLTNLKYYIKEALKFEAAWLQAQIQPHFLFNTLNSIASLAEIDTDGMVELIHAFGDYLQRSFSVINLEPTVSIQHAIELTNSYIKIEKARFGDRLHIESDIDDDINIMIPPLSIQPLVENAINHGVLQKVEGGTIIWSIKNHPTVIEVSVTDDGVGMSQKKVKEILDMKLSIEDGVGVKNTNRRLFHLYNQGLQIDSKLGEGTTVSFRIPKQQ